MNTTTNKLLYISTSLFFSLQLLASTESPSLASTKSTISPSSSCESLYGDGASSSPLSTARTGSPERSKRERAESLAFKIAGTVHIEPTVIKSETGSSAPLDASKQSTLPAGILFNGIKKFRELQLSESRTLAAHFGTHDSDLVVPVRLTLEPSKDCQLDASEFTYLPVDYLNLEKVETAKDGSQYLTLQLEDLYRDTDQVHLEMRLKLAKTTVQYSEQTFEDNKIREHYFRECLNFGELLTKMKNMHKLQAGTSPQAMQRALRIFSAVNLVSHNSQSPVNY